MTLSLVELGNTMIVLGDRLRVRQLGFRRIHRVRQQLRITLPRPVIEFQLHLAIRHRCLLTSGWTTCLVVSALLALNHAA